jgi:hypothetical protein
MTEHKTKRVVWGDREAYIDRGIASLILELWKADIDTCNSCENNVPRGWVWIEFTTAHDAESFLNIVAQDYDEDADSLYQRINRLWQGDDIDERKDWIYHVYPIDLSLEHAVDEVEGTCEIVPDGPAQFMFTVSIRFPRTHLAEVTRRMVKYNKEHSQMEVCPHCLTAHS